MDAVIINHHHLCNIIVEHVNILKNFSSSEKILLFVRCLTRLSVNYLNDLIRNCIREPMAKRLCFKVAVKLFSANLSGDYRTKHSVLINLIV